MQTIQQAMLEELYASAIALSSKNNQTVGEKKKYYITIKQLQELIEAFEA